MCLYISALEKLEEETDQLKVLHSQIKKLWYLYIYIYICMYNGIYIMEYYSTIKHYKIMAFAATWIDLEIIILSEVSQKERDSYHMMLLIQGIKNDANELL